MVKNVKQPTSASLYSAPSRNASRSRTQAHKKQSPSNLSAVKHVHEFSASITLWMINNIKKESVSGLLPPPPSTSTTTIISTSTSTTNTNNPPTSPQTKQPPKSIQLKPILPPLLTRLRSILQSSTSLILPTKSHRPMQPLGSNGINDVNGKLNFRIGGKTSTGTYDCKELKVGVEILEGVVKNNGMEVERIEGVMSERLEELEGLKEFKRGGVEKIRDVKKGFDVLLGLEEVRGLKSLGVKEKIRGLKRRCRVTLVNGGKRRVGVQAERNEDSDSGSDDDDYFEDDTINTSNTNIANVRPCKPGLLNNFLDNLVSVGKINEIDEGFCVVGNKYTRRKEKELIVCLE